MSVARSNHKNPGFPLISEKLAEQYFGVEQEAKYSNEQKNEITALLNSAEQSLQKVNITADPTQKAKQLKKAKEAVKKVIALNPKNYFCYILLPPILIHEYPFTNQEQQKQLLNEAIAALESAINCNAQFCMQGWLYIGYLHAAYGSQKKAKNVLEYILNNSPIIDWRPFLQAGMVFQEFVLPFLQQIDSIKALRIHVILLLELCCTTKEKNEKRAVNAALQSAVIALLKKDEKVDLAILLSQFDVVTLHRMFLDMSELEEKNPIILENRIRLFVGESPLKHEKNDTVTKRYQEAFRKTLIAYINLNCGRFPLDLTSEQEYKYRLILNYLNDVNDVTNPFVVIAKLRLENRVHKTFDLNRDIVSELVKFNRHMKEVESLRQDHNFSEKDRQAFQLNFTNMQSAIVELEILYIETLADKLRRIWFRYTHRMSYGEILTFPDKVELLSKKIEETKKKIASFNLPPFKYRFLDKILKRFAIKSKVISVYKNDIEAEVISDLEVKFIVKYSIRQKQILAHQEKEFKLSEDSFLILQHFAALDHFGKKDDEQAIGILEQLKNADPLHCYSLNILARAYFRNNRSQEALQVCEQSIAIYPTAQAYWILYNYYYGQQLFDKAHAILLWGLALEKVSYAANHLSRTFHLFDEKFFSDLANVGIPFNVQEFNSNKPYSLPLEAADEAFARKLYSIAFKYYTLACWVPNTKEVDYYIISQRVISLSLTLEGTPVELLIIKKDFIKLKKLAEDKYVDVVLTVAKNLLEKDTPKLKEYAKKLLQKICDDFVPAQTLLATLQNQENAQLPPKPTAQVVSAPAVVESEIKNQAQGNSEEEIDFIAAAERRRLRDQAQLAAQEAKKAELKEQERQLIDQYELQQRLLREAALKRQQEKRKKKKKKATPNKSGKSQTSSQQQAPALAVDSDSDQDVSEITTAAPVVVNEPAPIKFEEVTEEYCVELPLNLVRRLKFIEQKLGKGNVYATGGFVEKIVLGKPFLFERDVDFVTDRLIQDVRMELPEFISSSNSERTLICAEDITLNIPRLEIFFRKFLLLDIRLRNFISKTFRITELKVIGRYLVDVLPDWTDRNIKVKVIVTVSGLEEAFKSIREMKLLLPPGLTERSSFTTDATRIIQAITTCFKDGYSDQELDLKSFVYLIGKIISDKDEQHKLKNLKKTIKEAFKSGYFVPILQRWFELGIVNHLFGNLQESIKEALPFINIILTKQDEYNKQDTAGAHSKYGLVVIIASAIFCQQKGKLDATALAQAVTDYLAENLVFNDFIKKKEFITETIIGNEKAKYNKPIFNLLKDYFEPEQKDESSKNEKKLSSAAQSIQQALVQNQHAQVIVQAQIQALAQAQVRGNLSLFQAPPPVVISDRQPQLLVVPNTRKIN